jgi:hypothetical protein
VESGGAFDFELSAMTRAQKVLNKALSRKKGNVSPPSPPPPPATTTTITTVQGNAATATSTTVQVDGAAAAPSGVVVADKEDVNVDVNVDAGADASIPADLLAAAAAAAPAHVDSVTEVSRPSSQVNSSRVDSVTKSPSQSQLGDLIRNLPVQFKSILCSKTVVDDNHRQRCLAKASSRFERRVCSIEAKHFDTQSIAKILDSYASGGMQPGSDFMTMIEGVAVSLWGCFGQEDFAKMLGAYTTLGMEPGADLMRKLASDEQGYEQHRDDGREESNIVSSPGAQKRKSGALGSTSERRVCGKY